MQVRKQREITRMLDDAGDPWFQPMVPVKHDGGDALLSLIVVT